MPPSAKRRAVDNPSAILLTELAGLARTHHQQVRNTYHGVRDLSASLSSNYPLSASSSPVPASASAPSTPNLGPGTPLTPQEIIHNEFGNFQVKPHQYASLLPQHSSQHSSQHGQIPDSMSALTPSGSHHPSPPALKTSELSTNSHYTNSSAPDQSVNHYMPSIAGASAPTQAGQLVGQAIHPPQDIATPSLGLSSSSSNDLTASGPPSTSTDSQSVGKTDVDRMMLLVEAQRKAEEDPGKAKEDAGLTFKCEVDGCGKEFRQRAHLHTHTRSHTGERPFVCPFEGCHKYFSQRCNLRTHIRSHTGERPYKCSFCGRAFSQQGNMRHHQLVHYNVHPLICELDGCNKRFNQLGNLKAHQNSAHRLIVQRFIARLQAGCKVESLPEEERKMFAYFCDLYKNLNRGTRGRGKGTKTIAVRGQKPPSSSLPYSIQSRYLPPQFPPMSYSHMDDPRFMSPTPPNPETDQSLSREELRRRQDLVEDMRPHGNRMGRNFNQGRAVDITSEQTSLPFIQPDEPIIGLGQPPMPQTSGQLYGQLQTPPNLQTPAPVIPRILQESHVNPASFNAQSVNQQSVYQLARMDSTASLLNHTGQAGFPRLPGTLADSDFQQSAPLALANTPSNVALMPPEATRALPPTQIEAVDPQQDVRFQYPSGLYNSSSQV